MLLIQMTGLSGAGKSTIAFGAKEILEEKALKTEIIDGDEYRKHLCKDLGYSKEDRKENIRRLAIIANEFAMSGKIAIISAINPFSEIRREVSDLGLYVRTVCIKCDLVTLVERDTKGLYKRALLPDDHPQKIFNLTGINDEYEVPVCPDLVIDTSSENESESIDKFVNFILSIKINVADRY